jgi:hypothetical protein
VFIEAKSKRNPGKVLKSTPFFLAASRETKRLAKVSSKLKTTVIVPPMSTSLIVPTPVPPQQELAPVNHQDHQDDHGANPPPPLTWPSEAEFALSEISGPGNVDKFSGESQGDSFSLDVEVSNLLDEFLADFSRSRFVN